MTAAWTAVLLGSAGCFLLKLAGWRVPPQLLEDERVRRTAALLPVALLAALVVVLAFGDGRALVALVALPFVPAGVPVLLAGLVVLPLLARR